MDSGEKKLVELVNQWATYSEQHPNAGLADFCLHYLTEHSSFAAPTTDAAHWAESLSNQAPRASVPMSMDARLGSLVGKLSRYATIYSKKAMQPLNFKGIDDPLYLMALLQMGTPKKSELIYEMLSEFPSGIDIINRLIKMEYMEEFPDETDRRSKRLRITPQGMAIVQQCFPELTRVADIAFGTLTDGEKAVLVHLLDRLAIHHADHYKDLRNAGFEEVYTRMSDAS